MIDVSENKSIMKEVETKLLNQGYSSGHGGIIKVVPVVNPATFKVNNSLVKISLKHHVYIFFKHIAFNSYLRVEIEYQDIFVAGYHNVSFKDLPEGVKAKAKSIDKLFASYGYNDYSSYECYRYAYKSGNLNDNNIKKYIYDIADNLPSIANRVNSMLRSTERKKGRM